MWAGEGERGAGVADFLVSEVRLSTDMAVCHLEASHKLS